MTPDPNAKHAEKMAELRHEWEPALTAGMVRCGICGYKSFADSTDRLALLCPCKEQETRAYADQLHEQLEAERAERLAAIKEMAKARGEAMDVRGEFEVDHILMIEHAEERGGQFAVLYNDNRRLRKKLQSAERVIQVLRGGDAGWALRDALDAFDAINHDGSTGGAGEGVG